MKKMPMTWLELGLLVACMLLLLSISLMKFYPLMKEKNAKIERRDAVVRQIREALAARKGGVK